MKLNTPLTRYRWVIGRSAYSTVLITEYNGSEFTQNYAFLTHNFGKNINGTEFSNGREYHQNLKVTILNPTVIESNGSGSNGSGSEVYLKTYEVLFNLSDQFNTSL